MPENSEVRHGPDVADINTVSLSPQAVCFELFLGGEQICISQLKKQTWNISELCFLIPSKFVTLWTTLKPSIEHGETELLRFNKPSNDFK